MLEVGGLAGGYGRLQVLHGVDLAVPAGRITALVGGNGAGKTTTMAMLAGLLAPSAGTIRYRGDAVEGWSAAQRVAAGLVLVPEGRLVFPDMTVEENLRLGAINRQARSHAAEELEGVYAQFPRLAERRRQAAGTLSGGEQQMLALGRGLMSRPRLLLLDEPSLGLAPVMVDLIFDAIGDLAGAGMTILLSEQNVGLSLELAERAYVLENGAVALSGSGRDLLGNAGVQRAYLGL
ncbi:MAG: ABC transporter ATP-binding protein [Rhodospirillaceae bacterium]|nr:ABC transporter ATP-binding protein [Rhodospirillaceae bacterium]MYB13072.1 ABC transporter ATP-binding protein [Rhodospirillaceae bacterium]MYI50429.1 ABC transporter ATP-binding protein [Rhodospirillaceae bacterium]